jgi:large subunit ribosomal protein L6
MSRKGKQPISIPKGVEVNISGQTIKVKGPKGTLERQMPDQLKARHEGQELHIELKDGQEEYSNLHGLYRSLINNIVEGTSQGFERKLEMIGVGYRASVIGQELDLLIGLSHPMRLPIPKGIQVKVEKNTTIILQGSDKHEIGQFAAIIRSKKPPEPYQGKGIRYQGEFVRKKAGKTAAKK